MSDLFFSDIKKFSKCPRSFYLDNSNKKKIQFKEYIDTYLYDKFVQVASLAARKQKIIDIEEILNEYEMETSVIPTNTVLPSTDKYRDKQIKDGKLCITSFYSQLAMNKDIDIIGAKKETFSVVSHSIVYSHIDVITKDKKGNISCVILDFSKRKTDNIQRERDIRVILIENAFRKDVNNSAPLKWLSLSEDVMYDVDLSGVDISDYMWDIEIIVDNMNKGHFCRNQGFWCTSCKYYMNGCHTTKTT